MIFSGTKIFSVFLRPEDGLHNAPVFVKEGFNFYAFVFTVFWALYKRLWLPFIMILAFNVVLAFLVKSHVLLKLSSAVIQLGFNLIVGFTANDWVRARLLKRGYIVADVSAADNLLRAEQRYFERSLSGSSR